LCSPYALCARNFHDDHTQLSTLQDDENAGVHELHKTTYGVPYCFCDEPSMCVLDSGAQAWYQCAAHACQFLDLCHDISAFDAIPEAEWPEIDYSHIDIEEVISDLKYNLRKLELGSRRQPDFINLHELGLGSCNCGCQCAAGDGDGSTSSSSPLRKPQLTPSKVTEEVRARSAAGATAVNGVGGGVGGVCGGGAVDDSFYKVLRDAGVIDSNGASNAAGDAGGIEMTLAELTTAFRQSVYTADEHDDGFDIRQRFEPTSVPPVPGHAIMKFVDVTG
jgi:hypothetical protein